MGDRFVQVMIGATSSAGSASAGARWRWLVRTGLCTRSSGSTPSCGASSGLLAHSRSCRRPAFELDVVESDLSACVAFHDLPQGPTSTIKGQPRSLGATLTGCSGQTTAHRHPEDRFAVLRLLLLLPLEERARHLREVLGCGSQLLLLLLRSGHDLGGIGRLEVGRTVHGTAVEQRRSRPSQLKGRAHRLESPAPVADRRAASHGRRLRRGSLGVGLASHRGRLRHLHHPARPSGILRTSSTARAAWHTSGSGRSVFCS